ncbi:LytR C-terminal domain-containing protein [Arthrobacter sp. CAN_A1]|uniref:LytR C-terminal domain-containing protein n=1 Tax=Arthrobacter sp. CAN_A1 TaxID=2787717 RepID=UPI0018CB9BCB
MSQYPRDEFDKIPESASRQGVHRERLVPPRSSGLALKIIVGVLALAVGLAAYFILPRLGIGEGADPASSLATSSRSSGAATSEPSPSSATDNESSTPSPSDSGPSAEPTEDEPTDSEPTGNEPSPSEDPSAVDRTQPVNVFNSTGISGMASLAANRVSGGGWTVGQIADWGGVPPQTSVIFYNSAQLAAAQELAGILGIPTLVETTEVSPDLTVVIGPAFQ